MANKKPAPGKGGSAANARQAKIQAAAKSNNSGGANKIVIAAVVAVLAIVAVVGGVVWQQVAAKKEIVGNGNATPAGVALGAGMPAFTDVTPKPNAPTLDIYEDFQCPACAQFEQMLGSTISELAKAGDIKVVYHMKNFLDANLRNDGSTKAANAAFCAAESGKFQQFHDAAYANQPTEGSGYSDGLLKDLAGQAGLSGESLTTWQKCVDYGKYVNYVKSVEEQSSKDGVNGTPTYRLNGTILENKNIADPAKFKAVIAEATT
jgi:protein-disulfide isomerase